MQELSTDISRGLLESISTENAENKVRRRLHREVDDVGPPIKQKKSGKKKPADGLSTVYFLLVPVVMLLVVHYAVVLNKRLPQQVKIKDEILQPHRFVGERAELYVKGLADIGPKMVGSYANEVLAVNYLTKEIKGIIAGANDVHKYSFDIQRPTGSYYLDYKPIGLKNLYANIQNVVVRVSGAESRSNHSILLNCHYDSYQLSPGASDDGINCGVMLEILRKISHFKTPLQNNLVLLFNGAEENPLQASHAFITAHKWAHEARVLVNVDNCGSGREFLFQTSAEYPWLLQTYADSVPFPSASVTIEELFRANLVPSDTDFRIFRDFGSLPGYDFAQCDDGYRYHTKYDSAEYIDPDIYQHTGDNILALILKLTSAPELETMQRSKTDSSVVKLVYYDVFGLFLISYTETKAMLWNLSWSAISIWTIWLTAKQFSGNFRESLMQSCLVQLAGWCISLALLVIISKFLDAANSTLSWYLRPWLILVIYYLPLFYGSSVLPVFFQWLNQEKKSKLQQLEENIFGVQMLWTFLLTCGTLAGIRSSYLTMMLVFFPTVSNILLLALKNRFSGATSVWIRLTALLPALLFVAYLSVRLLTVLMPIMGRLGPHKNPELFIALIIFYFGTHFVSYLAPLLLLFRSPRKILLGLVSLNVLVLAAITMTSFGFPYRYDVKAPVTQRFQLIHTERTFFDQLGEVRRHDSGFWGYGVDRNNIQYVKNVIPEIANSVSMDNDCRLELYCGAPVYQSRMVSYMPYSFWAPTRKPPVMHNPTEMKIVNQTLLNHKMRRIEFKVTGTDHMTIIFSPYRGVVLKRWSFDDTKPQEQMNWNGRPTYLISYSHGLVGGTVEFTIDIQVPQEHHGSLLDMTVVGHYFHDNKYWTDEFQNLLARFPQWVYVMPWTAMVKSWVV